MENRMATHVRTDLLVHVQQEVVPYFVSHEEKMFSDLILHSTKTV